MQYTLTNEQFSEIVFWVAKATVYLITGAGLLYWLRKELTPRWLLSVVESEKVASARLILGSIIGVVTLCLQCANDYSTGGVIRISHEMATLNYEAVFGLFMLGPVKIVGKAIAARPPAPAAQITAKKVDATAAGDNNIKSENTTATAAELPEEVRA